MSASATTQPAQTTTPTFQRRGLSLSLRLSLIVLTVTLVVFTIVALVVQDRAREVLTQAAQKTLQSSTIALKDNIQTWLDLSTKALKSLSVQPAIASMDPVQQKPYLEALQQAFARQGDKDATYLVSTTDLNGLNVARSDAKPATDYSAREWFQNARGGQSPSFQTVTGATSGRPALVTAIPIISESRMLGVVMFASELSSIGAAVNANRVGETGQVYVVDLKNRPIAVTDPTVPPESVDPLDNLPIVQAIRAESAGLYEYTDETGERWHAYLESLPNGWGIAIQQKESEFLGPLRAFQSFALIAFGLGAVLLAVVVWVAIGRALKPIQDVANVAGVAAGGNLNVTLPVKRRDEVGALADAFNTMIVRLRELIGSLEQRITARTEQLQASAEVGRAAVSILETNQLLREIVNLITDRFGFYYAAVFLADSADKQAVLREATGEAGRILKERHHQLEIGGQSMVGSVMQTRKARIALDVGDEAVRFANPLLPDTRSEIALPLVVGGRVIGALDVQSTQMAAFDEASAAVLQSMADQIAIALSNTIQFNQTQSALQRSRDLYEASQALAAAGDVDSILTALINHATPSADRASVLLFGAQTREGQWSHIEYAATWIRPGLEQELRAIPAGVRVTPEQLPIVRLLKPDEPVLIANVETAGIDLDIQTLIQRFGVAAVIGIPLSVGRQELGFVMVGFRKAQIFEADLTEPLMALASQAAIALQNQRSSAASRATLQQLDEINRRLTGQAWSGYTSASGGAMHKLDLGPNEPVSDSGPLPTILAAPVMVRGQTIGSLRLEDDAPDREWTPSETALIQAVAGEVAIALENTRLIEETEKRASREARLNQISQQLRQATNINSILQTAAEQLSLALDTSHAQAQLGTSRPAAPRPNGQRDGSAEDSL